MNYAIIENGVVANIAASESALAANWIQSDTARMGDLYFNGVFTTPLPAPVPVPESVSPRQIRQALTRAGLRTSVEAAIAAGDQDTKDWYEFATEFRRNSPVVAALAAGLSVTNEQLDDLWRLAATL